MKSETRKDNQKLNFLRQALREDRYRLLGVFFIPVLPMLMISILTTDIEEGYWMLQIVLYAAITPPVALGLMWRQADAKGFPCFPSWLRDSTIKPMVISALDILFHLLTSAMVSILVVLVVVVLFGSHRELWDVPLFTASISSCAIAFSWVVRGKKPLLYIAPPMLLLFVLSGFLYQSSLVPEFSFKTKVCAAIAIIIMAYIVAVVGRTKERRGSSTFSD